MLVFAALIYMESCKSLAADSVIGDHTLNSQLKSKLGLLFHKLVVSYRLHVTDIACVMIVELLLSLFTCKNSLLNVGNDNEITAVNVRSESRLVFSAKEIGNLNSETAQ